MRQINYIIYHNDESFLKAQELSKEIPNHVFVKSPESKYCENYIFDYLETVQEQWQDMDYVGIFPYSTKSKVNLPNFSNLPTDPDVIAFYCAGNNVYDSCCGHPGLVETFIKMFSTINVSFEPLLLLAITKGFYCNIWMAKPKKMLDYINFFKKVKHICETDAEINKMMHQDAKYYDGKIPVEKKIQIFGAPYYTLHPFFFERLPSLFFNLDNNTNIYYRFESPK